MDETGRPLMTNQLSGEPYWGVDCLPRGAIGADWVFGANMNSFERYVSPELVRLTKDPETGGLQITSSSQVELADPLPRNPTLMLNPRADSTGLRVDDVKKIRSALRMPRARLLATLKTNRTNIDQLAGRGKEKIEHRFGSVTDDFKKRVIDELCARDRLHDEKEFYAAVALGYESLETIEAFIRSRFIIIRCDVRQRGTLTELVIKTDEDQSGLLEQLTRVIDEQKWDIDAGVRATAVSYNYGTAFIRLPLRASAERPLAALQHAIQGTLIPRGRPGRLEDGQRRLLRLNLIDHPGAFHRLTEFLAKRNFNIDAFEFTDYEHVPAGYRHLELELSGPDRATSVDEALSAETVNDLSTLSTSDIDRSWSVRTTPLVLAPRMTMWEALMPLRFRLLPSSKKDPAYFELTELASESQIGILAEMLRRIRRSGWHIFMDDPQFQQNEQAGTEIAARIRLRPPELATGETVQDRLTDLLISLRGIHRLKGERLKDSSGQRLRLNVRLQPGEDCLIQLLIRLADLGVNLEAIDQMTLDDTRSQSAWGIEATVPNSLVPHLRDDLQTLTTENNEPVVTSFEVIKNINAVTAQAAVRLLHLEMAKFPARYRTFQRWMDAIKPYPELLNSGNDPAERVDETFLKDLKTAISLANEAHAGQHRKSDGSPYVHHLLEATVVTLAHFRVRDPVFILAALLHDVFEDGPSNYVAANPQFERGRSHDARLSAATAMFEKKIRQRFPAMQDDLARIVWALSKKGGVSDDDYISGLTRQRQINLLAIKLADRLVNLLDNVDKPGETINQTTAVLKTLATFLQALSWQPSLTNEIYRWSHYYFLKVLMGEMAVLDASTNIYRFAMDHIGPEAIRAITDHLPDFLTWMMMNKESILVNRERDMKALTEFNGRLMRLHTELGRRGRSKSETLQAA